jgi:hypothetical protein
MTKQQFWKGLFMLIISIIMTILGPTPINMALVAISVIAGVLPYVGKNLIVFFNSDSPAGALSLVNIISGLLIALGAGLTEYLGQIIFEGIVVWPILWKVVIGVTLTYITSTFFAPPNSQSKKLFK